MPRFAGRFAIPRRLTKTSLTPKLTPDTRPLAVKRDTHGCYPRVSVTLPIHFDLEAVP